MDIAIYCHAGRKEGIVANVFDGYPEERRNSMNLHLQCPVCRAPVHFRKKVVTERILVSLRNTNPVASWRRHRSTSPPLLPPRSGR